MLAPKQLARPRSDGQTSLTEKRIMHITRFVPPFIHSNLRPLPFSHFPFHQLNGLLYSGIRALRAGAAANHL